MPHSTIKGFRRYAQVHDIDLCIAAKEAVTKYCRQTPSHHELMDKKLVTRDRMFISMPDTAMRCLELWSANTGISKQELMEWAIRKMTEKQNESEEDNES